jgi:PAS domain-containing protein
LRPPLSLLAAAVLVAGALAALLAAPARATLDAAGLSDQRPDVFADARISSLGLTGGRLVVRWDAALADPAPVDRWLAAAAARRLEPFVVFNRTPGERCPSAPCVLPSVDAYAAAFRAFRARWPQVTTFAPWNEANVRSQPPASDPRRAAEFYNVMVATCPSCTVLGAEVLDSTDAPAYLRAMLPAMVSMPKAWGVHNYEDVNHARTTGTDPILAAVPGAIWLTEAGGLVQYIDGRGRFVYPYDEERAARAQTFLFDYAEAHPDRVRRLYLYGWRSGGRTDPFDTALVRADGTPRPSYFISATRLARLLPAAPAATSAPVARVPFPFQLLSRRVRAGRRGAVLGPFRCVAARKSRCRGRLVLRRAGHKKPLGVRAFNVRGRRTTRLTVRVGPRTRARLRRGTAGKLLLEARVTRPRRALRSWADLRVVRTRRR